MNHDEFDRRIHSALRVDPSPQRLARLERFWEQQSRADQRIRMWLKAGVAAALLVAATGFSLLWPQLSSREPPQAEVAASDPPARVNPAPTESPRATLTQHSAREDRSLTAARTPTAHERLIFIARLSKPAPAAMPATTVWIDKAIDKINQDHTTDAAQLALSEGVSKRDAEAILLRRLQRSPDDKKDAILRLLGVCGSPRSIPTILEIGAREARRDQMLVTVEQIVGVGGLADVVRQTSNPFVREALIRRLLAENEESSLRSYLSLLREDDVRAEALAVAESFSELPLEPLLALLDDEQESVRLSAAAVLGHVNGPVVTESLIELVMRESSGHAEAWIALLACRGDLAEEFLTFASYRPRFLGHINSARVQLARMIP